MVEVIGFLSISIFLVSTVLQAYRVVKTRHATSYGWISLFLWLIGGAGTFYYNYETGHGFLLLMSGATTFMANFVILLTKFVTETLKGFF